MELHSSPLNLGFISSQVHAWTKHALDFFSRDGTNRDVVVGRFCRDGSSRQPGFGVF